MTRSTKVWQPWWETRSPTLLASNLEGLRIFGSTEISPKVLHIRLHRWMPSWGLRSANVTVEMKKTGLNLKPNDFVTFSVPIEILHDACHQWNFKWRLGAASACHIDSNWNYVSNSSATLQFLAQASRSWKSSSPFQINQFLTFVPLVSSCQSHLALVRLTLVDSGTRQ